MNLGGTRDALLGDGLYLVTPDINSQGRGPCRRLYFDTLFRSPLILDHAEMRQS